MGIPAITLADGPCGLRKQEGESDYLGIHDSIPATATVSGGCLAATWNPECARKNGQILGEEAANAKVDVLLAPALNLVRSPLCGRNFEYFSEDPYLTGEIAEGYARGVQEAGVGCCLKHFAGNNQETEREYINAVIDERTLRELYLPGFEMAVKQAKPLAVMAALNQINGEYGAENRHLLTDILRDEWGFDGFTVSDWFGIVHPDKAVKAGMDLDMPYSNGVGAEKIAKAVAEGTLPEAAVDGITELQKIRYITLPLIKPTIITMMLLSVGRIFYSDFGLFYQVPMNSGALIDATSTIDTYVYRGLITLGDVGMSSAAGFYQSVVGFVLILIANWITNKYSAENALF